MRTHINARHKILHKIFVLALSFMICQTSSAAKFIPVINGMFSTGQWYFEGEKSSLGGNATLLVVPAVQFSNSFSLIPTIETRYRGTRSAEELAGGNTLFSDTWENGVGLKAVKGLGRRWKARARVNAKTKFYRETTDEKMGDGLYDYNILQGGVDVEYAFSKKVSLALGHDYSFLKFPNYVSLESTQSDDMAREYAGDDVLDANIHLSSLRAKMPLPWKMATQVQGFYSIRNYTDQSVVINSGLLTDTKRLDEFTGGTLSLDRIFKTWRRTYLMTNIYYGYTSLDSNQNHYDARLTEFVPKYYDYDQSKVGMQLTFSVPTGRMGPMMFDLGGSYSHRNYRHRVYQDATGNYMNEKLHIIEKSINIGYSYPLSKFFRFRTTAFFGRSISNNQYEELYRYNFNNATYQFGFTYDY